MNTNNKHLALQKYVADQRAVLRHIYETLERHSNEKELAAFPNAICLLREAAELIRAQYHSITLHFEREFEAAASDMVVDGITKISGFFAGLSGKVRSESASRMIRDDITAVQFACVGYSMLLAAAAAMDERKTRTLATTMLHELTPVVVKLSSLVPEVVVFELAKGGYAVDRTAVGSSLSELRDAWSGENVGLHP